jgi:ribosomal protein S12 methylthiotransferase accessory factor
MPSVLDRYEESGEDLWTGLRQRLLPIIGEFGITRVASTTRLDRIGIPTASAVRPWTRDVIWVYSGKGLSQDEVNNQPSAAALFLIA